MERKPPSNSSATHRLADTSYFLDNSGNLSVILTNSDSTPVEPSATEKWIKVCQQRQVFETKIENNKSKSNDLKVRERFLSLFPEDQKAPLIAILDFAKLMHGNGKTLKSDNRHFSIGIETQFILDGILHLQEVIKEKISQDSERKIVDPHTSHDLFSDIEDSIHALSPLCKKRNITINNKSEITKEIYIKDSEFKPLFRNILFNALQWNVCDTSIDISYKLINSKNLRIKITSPDNPYAHNIASPKTLQPFNTVDPHTYMLEGSGIGLIIANKIIEFIGGGFSTGFKNGKGNIFDLVLPITESIKKLTIGKPQQTSGDERIILYIEDNPSHIELVSHVLKKLPHVKLASALFPEEGLKLATSIAPDLILLDIRLSGMNGYEVLEKLQKNPATQGIPVIALSAAAMTHEVKYGLQMGFKSYLTKPFHIKEFINVIEQELAEISSSLEEQL